MDFTKMQATSNDFIVIDSDGDTLFDRLSSNAAWLCDRRKGIGADGIITVEPCDKEDGSRCKEADFRMRIINADGSEAEMCGNGLRCAVLFFKKSRESTSDSFSIITGAGLLHAKVSSGNYVSLTMGPPQLDPAAIPVRIDGNRALDVALDLADTRVSLTAVSMGNPHAVLFYPQLDDELIESVGPALESHPLFPNKTNVEFVTVNSQCDIDMRVYERGVGETMACGTGACAAVVAGILRDSLAHEVTVHLRGGDLSIGWSGNSAEPVLLSGPACAVFDGTIELPEPQ